MASAPPTAPPARPQAHFGADLKNVAQVVRNALFDMVSSAGLDAKDPQSLAQKWGVNKALSWKIAKVIQIDDPFLAMQQLPRRNGVDILLKTGEKAGVDPALIESTKLAVEQFESFVKLHCGDRNTFDIMGSDLSSPGRQQREELHRKEHFQAGSYIWGVQARVCLNMRFVAPSAEPGRADIAAISGLLDFRRLRESLPWVMSKRQIDHDDGTPFPQGDFEPLDPRSSGEVPLLQEFCSQPPPVINVLREQNISTVELVPGQIGNAGVLSYVSGAIQRRLPNTRTASDQFSNLITMSNTPAELMIFDVFFHESMSYAIPPFPLLLSMLGPLPASMAGRERYRLPLHESVMDLGSASPAPATPDVPRYAELVQTVFQRTGWSASEFRGFRLKIAYPPVPTAVVMRYSLPE